MKKIFFFCTLAAALCSFTGEQYFHGTIVYSIKYESIDPVFTVERMPAEYGDTMKFSFNSEKGYTERYNGTKLIMKYYTFKDDIGTIDINKSKSSMSFNNNNYNGFKPNETIRSIDVKQTELKILGHSTQLVSVAAETIYNEDGIDYFNKRDYYFSNDLKIPADCFKNKVYDSYNQVFSKTNTLPLKMVFENAAYRVTYIAVEIK